MPATMPTGSGEEDIHKANNELSRPNVRCDAGSVNDPRCGNANYVSVPERVGGAANEHQEARAEKILVVMGGIEPPTCGL